MNQKRQRTADKHAIQQNGIEKIDSYLQQMHDLKNMPEQISQEDNVYINKIFSEKQLTITDYQIRGLKNQRLKLQKKERELAINAVLQGYKEIKETTKETTPDKELFKSSGRGDVWLKKQQELLAQTTN